MEGKTTDTSERLNYSLYNCSEKLSDYFIYEVILACVVNMLK